PETVSEKAGPRSSSFRQSPFSLILFHSISLYDWETSKNCLSPQCFIITYYFFLYTKLLHLFPLAAKFSQLSHGMADPAHRVNETFFYSFLPHQDRPQVFGQHTGIHHHLLQPGSAGPAVFRHEADDPVLHLPEIFISL